MADAERLSEIEIIACIARRLEGRGIGVAEKDLHTEQTGEITVLLRSMPSPVGNYIILSVSSAPAEYGELAERLNAGPDHRWSAFLPMPKYELELGVIRGEDELELLQVTTNEGLLHTRESLDEMIELAIEVYNKPKNYPRHVPMRPPHT